MNWGMFLGISAPYTQQELYELWLNFRDDPHSEQMLADFMGEPKAVAAAASLIDDFELRYRKDHCYEREGSDF